MRKRVEAGEVSFLTILWVVALILLIVFLWNRL